MSKLQQIVFNCFFNVYQSSKTFYSYLPMKNRLLIVPTVSVRQQLSMGIGMLFLLAGFLGMFTHDPSKNKAVQMGKIPYSYGVDILSSSDSDMVQIKVSGERVHGTILEIVDLLGKVKYSNDLTQDGTVQINIKEWSKGIYLVQVGNSFSPYVARRLVVN